MEYQRLATARGSMEDEPNVADEQFVSELTSSQPTLFAFIVSLVRDFDLSKDVLQETNIVLWRKRHQFRAEQSFRSWAKGIAAMKAKEVVRKFRNPKLWFDDRAIDRLTEGGGRFEDESRLQADLRDCVDRLSSKQKELLSLRYRESCTIRQIATSQKRTESAIARALYRVRLALISCLEWKERNREAE